MDRRTRTELTRYGAPAAFLAAATIAVLLIRSAVGDGPANGSTTAISTERGSRTAPASTAPTVKVTVAAPTSSTTTATTPGVYYTVQSGDTLDGIAVDYDTSVEALLRLNPGIDPTALRVGAKIRVG